MTAVKEYLLTVTTSAIICCVAKQIIGEKSSAGKITKVVSGVFLTVTLLSPLVNFNIADIDFYLEDTKSTAAAVSDMGADMAASAMGDIIKNKTEAYILDEARKMELDITVEVELSDADPPAPCRVFIKGTASPYKKTVLGRYISDYLGIPQENQQWI